MLTIMTVINIDLDVVYNIVMNQDINNPTANWIVLSSILRPTEEVGKRQS